MPMHEYRCIDCAAMEQRLGGLHDCVAICARCAGLMLRFDGETMRKITRMYFEKDSDPVFFLSLGPKAK